LFARTALSTVGQILEAAYGTPDLGNTGDPLDELLYLLINQRTRIELARRVYEDLRSEFHPWNKVLRPQSKQRLKRVLSVGGRGRVRYRAVTEVLAEIEKRVGRTSLHFLRRYPPEDAERFLLSLPWVGKKTAYCVLMYSLGHPVFPADSNIIRVFRRTGILDPAGVSLEGVDHRTAQRRIAPIVRGDGAYALHVNMVVHGREVCVKRTPQCGICPIRMYCQRFRGASRKEAEGFRYKMVDLFSGAGGISYGFALAGIRPVLAVDNHVPSCETYRLNIPWIDATRVLNEDITSISDARVRELVGHGEVDVLVAGVPCQGFSRVGIKTKPSLRKKRPPEKEPVNKLFMEVIRWARLLRPRIVLLENVPAMGSSKIFYEDSKVGVRQLLDEHFEKMGYSCSAVNLNSADFGIPQVRRRMFFFAIARELTVLDVGKELVEFWRRTGASEQKKRGVPMQAALRGLPRLSPCDGANIAGTGDNYPDMEALEPHYEEFVYDNPMVVFNHVARFHNDDDMAIISSLRPGETYKKLVARKPEVVRNRKRKVYSVESFHDKFYRLDPARPCRTIVSHLSKDGNSFIHPYEDRSITVREAARVQTFPDSFMFTGSRTQQFIQVGNAVPPLLAKIIASFFVELLDRERT